MQLRPPLQTHTALSPNQDEAVNSRHSLDNALRDSLPDITLVLAVLYVIFTVSHLFTLSGNVARTMAAVAAVTAGVNLAQTWLFRWRKLPSRWAHIVTAGDTLLVLFNVLLHLYLTDDPLQTINVALFLIGVGFLGFSTMWWLSIVGITLLGWGGVVVLLGPDPMWQHFGFAIASAIAVSVVVHIAHRRMDSRLERLRTQSEHQQSTLERALHIAERAQRGLETTVSVAQQLTAILDLETLLNRIAALIQENYGYDYVGVFLFDESRNFVVARAGTGDIGRRLCVQRFRLAVGTEGIIGWVAQHRETANVPNVREDSRYLMTDETSQTRSELALPLAAAGEFLGVLDIQSNAIEAFSAEDVRVLEALANQVTVAILNASRYRAEQTRRQLSERLYDIGLALSRTLSLPDVLSLILDSLSAIVPFNRGSVMLDAGAELTIVAAKGFPASSNPLDLRVPITEGDIFDEIRRTHAPLLVPDVQARSDWQYVENLPPARAWLGVPLAYQEKVIGMLSLTRERPEPYTEDEVTLSAAFASHAAMALQNARLYESIYNINQELEETVRQLRERSHDLQVIYTQLEHLDRTKSDFISVASHELRSPLTVLRGYSRMLLDDPRVKGNDYHFQIVSGIQSGIERMEAIVSSIIDMAKIDSRVMQFHPERLSLSHLVESVRATFHEVCQRRNLTITLDGLKTLPMIEADTEALRKVIYHLLMNAVKYTPDGGKITISAHLWPANDVEYPDGSVEIIVSDTGIGIDPSAKELIFAKFYRIGEVAVHSSGTTKFKGGGPGLGLAIARGIVEAHGGKIWAESPGYNEELCPGSRFHVILPLKSHTLDASILGSEYYGGLKNQETNDGKWTAITDI